MTGRRDSETDMYSDVLVDFSCFVFWKNLCEFWSLQYVLQVIVLDGSLSLCREDAFSSDSETEYVK